MNPESPLYQEWLKSEIEKEKYLSNLPSAGGGLGSVGGNLFLVGIGLSGLALFFLLSKVKR